jgi:hypothetical protein
MVYPCNTLAYKVPQTVVYKVAFEDRICTKMADEWSITIRFFSFSLLTKTISLHKTMTEQSKKKYKGDVNDTD